MQRARKFIAAGLLGGLVAFSVPTLAAEHEGKVIGGIDVGAVLPTNAFDRFSTTGFVAAPFVGYMFSDYFGAMAQLQGLVVPNRSRGIGFEETTSAIGFGLGPRIALPLGPMELYGTFQGGLLTGLTAPSAITDTSWGFSTGGGVNFPVTETLSLGAWGRWNRQYQRSRGVGDVRYASTGISVTLNSAPPPPPVKQKIVLRGVNFDFDKSNIRADARPVLDEAINILKHSGGIAVIAEGHTDSRGTDAYNLTLSERRAKSVRDYLVNGGISATRIQTVGLGESQPVASNATDEGRAQNRRVELRVSGE